MLMVLEFIYFFIKINTQILKTSVKLLKDFLRFKSFRIKNKIHSKFIKNQWTINCAKKYVLIKNAWKITMWKIKKCHIKLGCKFKYIIWSTTIFF